jgi:hypothetical protein
LRFIDSQRPTSQLKAVRLLNRVLSFAGGHVDECESPGTAGLAIVDEFD